MYTDDSNDRYRAPALDKGLDILELLAGSDTGFTQAEIAKALGRTPNETYRMLDRLVRRSYVLKTPDDRYELSLKLFVLAHQHAPVRRLVSQAMPVMRAFSQEAQQSCHLAVYDRGSVVVVAQIDAPGYWGMAVRVGARVSLHNTGSGHVLLAFSSEQERRFMLAEHKSFGTGTRVSRILEAELRKIRARGYESMPSTVMRGITDLSVPVLGSGGAAIAALTCPFVERIDGGNLPGLEVVIGILRKAGVELSQVSRGPEEA